MLIRPIENRDIRAVLNIYNYYIENTTVTFECQRLNFAQFKKRIDEITAFYPWLILEDNEKIIGYGYYSAFNPRDAYQWSADLSLYLDPQARRNGYGSLLLSALEARASQQGIVNLVSLITATNTASLIFHQKHGFQKCAQLPNIGYKNGWLDVFFYIKQINPPQKTPAPIQAWL